MNTVPKNWVWAAAVVLSLTAVGSLVLGATRGGPGRDAVTDIGPLAPTPNTSDAKPIADLTAEDAHFRQIAREEAQAALAKTSAPRPKAAPKTDDDVASDDTSGTPASSGDSAGAVATHTPTAAKTPTVATPAAAAGQRALLGGSARSASPSSSGSRSVSGTSNPYPPGSAPD